MDRQSGNQPRKSFPNRGTNPLGNAFCGSGSGLIRGGLGAYGGRILGSSSEYVQSNLSKYISNPQYYFQVNDHFVRNKLKVILFPFLHKGHWTRLTESVGGRLCYKAPVNDINSPDLYIPLMAFTTYLVLAGISLGISGNFSPEALNWQFVKGVSTWFLQVMLMKVSVFSLGDGEAPFLDIVAYAGYTFPWMSVAVVARILLGYAFYLMFVVIWICLGTFLVKTMKCTLFAEVRSYDFTKHHYQLLGIAVAQFPLIFWLSNTSGNWLS